MQIKIQQEKLEKFKGDLLVLKWVTGQKMDGSTGAVDRVHKGAISQMMKEEKFEGKEGDILVFPTFGKIAAKKVMVLGLGEQKNVTVDCLRRSAARIVKEARRLKAKKVGTIFIGTGSAQIEHTIAAKALTEGALLGAYTYNKYKAKEIQDEAVSPSEFIIVTDGAHESSKKSVQEKIHEAQLGVRQGIISAEAAIYARDLVNEPASNIFPKALADAAAALAPSPQSSPHRGEGKGEGRNSEMMDVKIYDQKGIEKMGMGGLLGVAKGSDDPPYFAHLIYRPAINYSGNRKRDPSSASGGLRMTAVKKLVIIGKAVTFDSGGLSLKPADAMGNMKIDMAGGAAILGVFQALKKLKPNIEVHGLLPICENMPSGRALKPGDILKIMSGKTVEILNTDAEGRLTLADALSYAVDLKPDYVVDIATLTGACVAALGEEVAGMMGNNRFLLDMMEQAAERSGEKIWELPLVEEYRQFVTKSEVADLTNITTAKIGGGAITAGLFLEEFVNKMPWVHLDIAGPAWAEKNIVPYVPKGGSGFGVRTVLELITQLSRG